MPDEPPMIRVDDPVGDMQMALHRAGIGCKPNVPNCRATHRGHAVRILAELREAASPVPAPTLDVELLGRAIDLHNEKEEPFAAVHCSTGDDCHKRIAQDYRDLASETRTVTE